ASRDCLLGVERSGVDGLFLATTTAPFAEKMASTLAATALDLPRSGRTLDFTNSLRAGTGALLAAADAVKAGSLGSVLVAAADSRMAPTQGELEQFLGDGGATILVGDGEVIATIEDSYSVSHELTDVWRIAGDEFLHTWEDRFALDEGYNKIISEAVAIMLDRHNLNPSQVNRVAFYGPNRRRHQELGRRMGFASEQLQDSLLSQVGNTGAALPLMMLVAALEESRPGDTLLLAGYGNGCDVLLLRVTDNISKMAQRRGIRGYLASRKPIPSYQKYLLWRGLVPVVPASRPDRDATSATAVWREQQQNLALYGSRCKHCGAQQFPIQRICVKCRTKDEYEKVRLVDKKVNIFTFTQDNLAAAVDSPVIVSVVEFEGGGRSAFDMTDRDPEEVQVGMPVEFTFRKLYTERGIHNYFWKTRPVR
ncbi:MAG: 3-oxoacyl-[acyl-carrier-protein] synthase III C-terminal domain-containing protein, partial [Dehalococcoidia bacterium]|nr:3-oxoacyl-[acyl-carrier-protein] synthase III C-terminal domain-containing protein [Dehalococcoidia bacterium]